ncbi:uncharacterized protein LY79DRAFT_542320 [Colletotrichum navitas]|uniref:Uncharacterized protein n=1 Tax=Colletotrichum navitas TaxID=681940 RepID=A0AAD8Q735_9PEZI|nr:uncharacterized protein LY79DRAFT_542320 [Colletotrichum navitas]KAK1597151.1 hypothetical protein LY79DRAFT_542320 [Colletotrichum navitas]
MGYGSSVTQTLMRSFVNLSDLTDLPTQPPSRLLYSKQIVEYMLKSSSSMSAGLMRFRKP